MYIPSIGTLKDFKQGYDLGCDLQQSLWGCGVVLEWRWQWPGIRRDRGLGFQRHSRGVMGGI